MYEYKAIIENIVDGDTFDLNVDLGFNVWHKMRVRLLDVDTPEIKVHRGVDETKYGKICKMYAERHFLGKECVVHSRKDEKSRTDSFGRYLVYCIIDGQNIVELYNNLGINKKCDTYSTESVERLVDFC